MPRSRQRSRRARGAWKAAAAAAGEGAAGAVDVMDSGKNPDYVERLASNYMSKCKVESSTDSESDNNTEGCGTNVSVLTSPVDVKTMDFQKLQFLDPYDGDSEETIHSGSDCDLKFVGDHPQEPCSTREDPLGMDCGLNPVGELQCEGWNLMSYSDPQEKVKTSWHSLNLSEKSNKSAVSVTCSSDLSMDSGMVTEDAAMTSVRFLMIGLDSRIEMSSSPIFPTSLTSEENTDFSMFETSLTKRKGGTRTESEKTRRKKPRITEYMQT
ncbi:uncharacterized protein LOC130295568 [Hyla sarda]|uniref:uncharacterized protein LOC130295568 n=1 Tax=Hyla sarda TaxID=327740 RepID=UPI0024C444F9|nr:uncharacterized protein LOC130295568 [Hyla sarda]